MGGKSTSTTPEIPPYLESLYRAASNSLGGAMQNPWMGQERWYGSSADMGTGGTGGYRPPMRWNPGGTEGEQRVSPGGGSVGTFGSSPRGPTRAPSPALGGLISAGGGGSAPAPGGMTPQTFGDSRVSPGGGGSSPWSGPPEIPSGGFPAKTNWRSKVMGKGYGGDPRLTPYSELRSRGLYGTPGVSKYASMGAPSAMYTRVGGGGEGAGDRGGGDVGGGGSTPPPWGGGGGDEGGGGGGINLGGIGSGRVRVPRRPGEPGWEEIPSNFIPGGQDTSPMTGGTLGFWAPNARRVAGASPLMELAAGRVPEMLTQTTGEQNAAGMLGNAWTAAQKRVTGESIANDPALAAADMAFQENIMPGIESAASNMGLGRSTALSNAEAKSKAQYLLPMVQGALQREERGINRELQGALSTAGQWAGLGQQETGRFNLGLQNMMNFGQIGRGIAQEGNDAMYEDFLRRQGLAELPARLAFGQAPNAIGQTTSRGGLFK